MHNTPCHSSKRTRKCLECNETPVLKWPGNSPEMNSIEKVSNTMKNDIGNQLSCLKEEMWTRVCEAPNVLEELNNSMPRRISDRIKQMEVQQK